MGIKNVIGELQVNSSPVVTEGLIENTRVISATATDTASAVAIWNKENNSFDFTFGLPKGEPGTPGESVTITSVDQKTGAGETSKVTFSDGKTLDVKNGEDGNDGKSVELQKTPTHIQWRQIDGSWDDLVALSDLKGEDGNSPSVSDVANEAAKLIALDDYQLKEDNDLKTSDKTIVGAINELDTDIGDIQTALDSIIAQTNAIIGGN